MGSDIIRAQEAKRQGLDLNKGCGLNACHHLPYRPFGMFVWKFPSSKFFGISYHPDFFDVRFTADGGISFEESSRKIHEQVTALLDRKKIPIQSDPSEILEIDLNQEIMSKVQRYYRRIFVLNLEKYPRSTVRNKTVVIKVRALTGDPDLYVSVAEPPTEKEYLWRSNVDGHDVIKIHPEDPNYRIGMFFIAVSDASTDSSFSIQAALVQPTRHNDEGSFGRIQSDMYHSIKSGIHISEHRRKLCAVGKITNLSSAMKHCTGKGQSNTGSEIKKTGGNSLSTESEMWRLPALPETKKRFQSERQ